MAWAGSARGAVALVVIALVAGALRLAVMERTFPVKPLGDEVYYALVAASLAADRGHVYGSSRALRPPAQAWVLSLVADPNALVPPGRPALDLQGLRPLLRLEVALGTALVLATALLGFALFDARTALAAGAVAAVYPTFVAYSHYLWGETLFALLATLALAALVAGERRESAALAVLSGLLFGAAALTRELALPVAAAGVLWAVWSAAASDRRAALARGALLLAATVLVVVPWTFRNYEVLGGFVPVSSVGWLAIGEGNSLEGAKWLRPSAPERSEFRREVLAIPDEMARAAHARRRTLEKIAEQQPAWLFRKLAHNVPLMLSPDAFQLYKLRNGSYGDVSPGRLRAVALATVLSYAAVAGLACFGIAGAQPRDRRLLALLVLGAVLAVHVVANANSRFRMPWMPLLTVFAAHAALSGGALFGRLSRGARLGALAAATLLCVVCVSYFWVDFG